jgi:hypothetical protein
MFYHIFIEKRQAEAQRIRSKYPDRIPVCYHNLQYMFLFYLFLFLYDNMIIGDL